MTRLPGWLRQEITGASCLGTKSSISKLGLNTVCSSALCPNINHCFSRARAAFMILGEHCTRHCKFCNLGIKREIIHSRRGGLNLPYGNESERIVKAVKILGLRYVVITSVTRDDLPDGGAAQFSEVIELLRSADKDIRTEVLIPDFQGSRQGLSKVVASRPFMLAHNLETVQRLYAKVRPEADYGRSLNLLRMAREADNRLITKSSLMLGLGEQEDELVACLKDLRKVDCDIITLGQYLSPSVEHYPVKEFISPEKFREYAHIAASLGFKKVLSGPKVRSSYGAEEVAEALASEGGLIYA